MTMPAQFVFTLTLLSAPLAFSQTIVNPQDQTKFDDIFDRLKGDSLKCDARSMEPFVDFAFRFELRYTVDCEVNQFGGQPGEIKTYLRVRSASGTETVLGDRFAFNGAPKPLPLSDLNRVHAKLQFSGVLAAGPGEYDMDLLVIDNRTRAYRRRWTARAFPRGHENDLDFSIPPNTLAPLTTAPIPVGVHRNGEPLTVLINAAPLNPWSRKLRAWDRAFLLDSLSSLLRQLPYSSVRVIAFNLEQQQEIYRQDKFSQKDIEKLSGALHSLELGTIAYSTLQRERGWADLLVGLLQGEIQSEEPSNAVVFLGPTLRLEDKIPAELLLGYRRQALPLFCVTYYPRVGADFPDSIQHLTTALKGKVFRIHSPSELAQNLQKLQREIKGDAGARTSRFTK